MRGPHPHQERQAESRRAEAAGYQLRLDRRVLGVRVWGWERGTLRGGLVCRAAGVTGLESGSHSMGVGDGQPQNPTDLQRCTRTSSRH